MAGQSLARPTSASGLDRLRQQFAPKATDEDLGYFAEVCRHLDVDPWAGHICLIGRLDRTTGEMVHKPQLMVAGRRYIAQRTGHLRGIVGPEWCAARGYTEAGQPTAALEWSELWDRDAVPYAARCLVYRDDWDRPANGTVKWSEFAQTYQPRGGGERKPIQTWAQMPTHMLGKVAESLALRRAFSEVETAIAVIGGDDDGDAASMAREVEAEVASATPRAVVEIQPEADPPDPISVPAGALEERLFALPDQARIYFRSWRRSRAYGWPPDDPAVLAEMSRQVDQLEEDLAADADTYGDDPA